MKKFTAAMLTAVASLGLAASAQAEVYQLQVDKALSLPQNYFNTEVVFTAPETGTLVLTSIGDNPNPNFSYFEGYTEGADISTLKELQGAQISWNPWMSTLPVKKDVTYLFLSTGLNSSIKLTATMGLQTGIVSVSPQPDVSLPITGSAQLEIKFNDNTVNASGATVAFGNVSRDLPVICYNGYMIVQYSETIYNALVNDHSIEPGDPITITIHGITSDDKTVQSAKEIGTDIEWVKDGEMVISYICPNVPVEYVSCSKASDSPFLSFYPKGDPDGCIRYEFTGPVTVDPQNVIWRYGSAEINNGYADGTIPATCEGNVITLDCTGVMRNMYELAPAAAGAFPIEIYLYSVRDSQGHYIYTPGQGTVGQVRTAFPYQLVPRVDVLSEFVPASGSNIDDVNQITIWLNPLDRIEFSGVNFSYTQNGKTHDVLATYTVDEDATDSDGYTPIYVKVPAEVRGKGEVTVTLANLQVMDSYDHANDVKAIYKSEKYVFGVRSDNVGDDAVCTVLRDFTAYYDGGLELGSPAQTITISNNDREVVASVVADAEHVKLAVVDGVATQATFSLDEPVIVDGRYILLVPEGTFLLGAEKTPNELFSESFSVVVPDYEVIGSVKVSPNPVLPLDALTTVNLTWIDEDVVSPNSDMNKAAVYDAEGNKVSDVSFSIPLTGGENSLVAHVATPVAVSGQYTLKIPYGQILAGQDAVHKLPAFEVTYTVDSSVAPADLSEVVFNPAPSEPVESLAKFTMTFVNAEAVGSDHFEDTLPVIDNKRGVPATASISYPDDFSILNEVIVTLSTELTEDGEYTITFPAGWFNFNDDPDNLSKEITVTYTVVAPEKPVELEYTLSPSNDQDLKSLSHFDILFPCYETVGVVDCEKRMPILNADGQEIDETMTAGYDEDDFDNWNKVRILLSETLAKGGTYTFDFPEGTFNYNDNPDNLVPAFSVLYTISSQSGVEGILIADDTDVAVYDLTGCLVRAGKGLDTINGLKGLYVVNGLKVILR